MPHDWFGKRLPTLTHNMSNNQPPIFSNFLNSFLIKTWLGLVCQYSSHNHSKHIKYSIPNAQYLWERQKLVFPVRFWYYSNPSPNPHPLRNSPLTTGTWTLKKCKIYFCRPVLLGLEGRYSTISNVGNLFKHCKTSTVGNVLWQPQWDLCWE